MFKYWSSRSPSGSGEGMRDRRPVKVGDPPRRGVFEVICDTLSVKPLPNISGMTFSGEYFPTVSLPKKSGIISLLSCMCILGEFMIPD